MAKAGQLCIQSQRSRRYWVVKCDSFNSENLCLAGRPDVIIPQSRFHNAASVINGNQTKFMERLATINICGCVSDGRVSVVSVIFLFV